MKLYLIIMTLVFALGIIARLGNLSTIEYPRKVDRDVDRYWTIILIILLVYTLILFSKF